MKIAVLTYHRAFSYGALLQCYALSSWLRQQGHKVKLLRSDLHGENTWKYWLNSFTKCAPFKDFRKHFLPSEARSGESFDLYIVGSDQVWNPSFPKQPLDFFFASLPENARRISYAASFGMESWSFDERFTQQVQECLSKFSLLTVREEGGVRICKEIFNLHAEVVLDPTLLLEDFRELYIMPQKENGTIFYYRVSQRDDWGGLPEYVADELKLQLYTPSLKIRFTNLSFCGGLNGVYPSVQEWLNAIRSSSFVLTDSFHTMVFAILNKKPFVVLPSVKSRMGRVVSLLSDLGLADRYFNSVDDLKATDCWKSEIDYASVFDMLRALRLESEVLLKEYLQNLK